MELSLSGLQWEVKGYWPYVPIKEKSMETGQTLHGVTPFLPARVPGGVHFDLWKSGLLEHPYAGLNSLKCEWVENRWWMYRVTVPGTFPGVDFTGRSVKLVCKGLDYEAAVFWNDEQLGEHRGMFDALILDLTGRIREENKLVVIFKGIPQEMGQIGYTSKTSTQKSRFGYKWDFSTRLVNIGFWQDVCLRVEDQVHIHEAKIDTGYEPGAEDGKSTGFIWLEAEIADERTGSSSDVEGRLKVTALGNRNSCDVALLKRLNGSVKPSDCGIRPGDIVYEQKLQLAKGIYRQEIRLRDPAVWWPNGSGEQPLYQVSLVLRSKETGKVYDTRSWNVGIRSVALVHNEQEHENALPYTFLVNGRKLYCKGVNMTPLDHIYGNVTKEQYAHMVAAMVNGGVNLVRIWGGGLIEKEEFYDLCDENGIMIWQEFIQSSSGIDNKPAEEEGFLELLKKNAAAAVKEKRNHTALAVYSGGNELMEAPDRPSSCENRNIAMLQEIVEQYDGKRPFLPTSASGPREFISREKGVSHDVHGSWRYEGNPQHYELYGNSDNLFHSEFGMDAAASVKSLQKFLPKQALHPTPMSSDPDWQHHGEWWGTYFRDCEMFGKIEKTPEQLELFVKCSQFMQSEGLRFILEADRRRAFRNSGVIIWQLNEPWPNASCTNLIDYFGETKPAYYEMKKVYGNLHVSLDYRSLYHPSDSIRTYPVHASNSGEAAPVRIQARVCGQDGKEIYRESWEGEAAGGRSTQLGSLRFTMPPELKAVFVTLDMEYAGEKCAENTYVFAAREQEVFAPLREGSKEVTMRAVLISDAELCASNRLLYRVTLCNVGACTVVQAGVALKEDTYWMLGTGNYVTLMPGQEKELKFLLIPKSTGTFLENENWEKDSALPEFVLQYL